MGFNQFDTGVKKEEVVGKERKSNGQMPSLQSTTGKVELDLTNIQIPMVVVLTSQ
jgi:hypothetical protein